MKLAYVYDAVYPWETGGVQKRVWELARRLAGRHDVHWYGLHYWDGPRVVEREGVTLHGVAAPPDLYVGERRSITEALSFAAAVAGPLRAGEFDVVDCQEFPYFPCFSSRYAALGRDTTLVVTWHEIWGDYWSEYLGRLGVAGRVVERLATRVPDHHVAVSERTRRDLRAMGVEEVSLVPNGIDPAAVDAAPEADRDVDLLFVGRFIPEKDAGLLVRAVDELRREWPDLDCVLVGDGPERERIERLVADRGLESTVTVLGFRDSHAEVLGLMRAAEVFVLPSRREGFGMTALEALACGTPVVTVDHPRNAAADLVTDGRTGALCEPTPTSLAAGIRRARPCAGRDCAETARSYDWDALVTDLERFYREVGPERAAPLGPRGAP